MDLLEKRFNEITQGDDDKAVQLIDTMDDIIFDAVQRMLKTMGLELEANQLTNEFLMEIRNKILEEGPDCLEIK